MATNTTSQSLRDELASYNDRLDEALRSRYSMTFRTFKLVKAITQLVGALSGAGAMYLGAPPALMMLCITAVISGPEIIEYLIEANAPDSGGGGNQ